MTMRKRTLGPLGILLIMALAGTALGPAAQAQDLKIGYTDDELILVNMPEYQDVQQQLQQSAQSQQQQLQQQQQQLQQDFQNFQEQQSMMNQEKRQQRAQQFQQRMQKLRQQQQQQQQQLMQQEQKLMQPLLTRLQNAIDEVAAAQNLNMVLRSQSLLYVDEGNNMVDITSMVASNLGIEVDTSGTPTAPSPLDNSAPSSPMGN